MILNRGKIVYPLAFSKDKKIFCELCQREAHLQCKKCRVAFYCCAEHFEADLNGIHDKLCDKLSEVRSPTPFFITERERLEHKNKIKNIKENMLRICMKEAQKYVFEKKFNEATASAIQSLKFDVDLNGTESLGLISSYLILSEASIGLLKIPEAENYLSQAKWIVMKNKNASNLLKSNMFRNFGLLYLEKKKYDEALTAFSKDIYYASLDSHQDSVLTIGGYFNLARVFEQRDQLNVSSSIYHKVVQIWFTRFEELYKNWYDEEMRIQKINVAAKLDENKIIKIDKNEAIESEMILTNILKFFRENKASLPDLSDVYTAFIYLNFLNDKFDKSREYLDLRKNLDREIQPSRPLLSVRPELVAEISA